MDINSAKSYATLENLNKALAKLEIDNHPHLVVRNTEGRWTAIFPFSNYRREDIFGKGGMSYVAYYASLGFFTLG